MRVLIGIINALVVMTFLAPEVESVHSGADGSTASSFTCSDAGCDGGQTTCVVMDVPTHDYSDFCIVTCYESGDGINWDEPLRIE